MPSRVLSAKELIVESHREGYRPGGRVLLFPDPSHPYRRAITMALTIIAVGLLIGHFAHL